MNPYDVLGVEPDAAPEEIRNAYLDLVHILRSDRFASASPHVQEQARRRLEEVQAAWAALTDGGRRATADAERPDGQASVASRWDPPPPPPATPERRAAARVALALGLSLYGGLVLLAQVDAGASPAFLARREVSSFGSVGWRPASTTTRAVEATVAGLLVVGACIAALILRRRNAVTAPPRTEDAKLTAGLGTAWRMLTEGTASHFPRRWLPFLAVLLLFTPLAHGVWHLAIPVIAAWGALGLAYWATGVTVGHRWQRLAPVLKALGGGAIGLGSMLLTSALFKPSMTPEEIVLTFVVVPLGVIVVLRVAVALLLRQKHYEPGDVVWVYFPFEEKPSEGKDRPAMVYRAEGSDLWLLKFTSKEERDGQRGYLPIGRGPWDGYQKDSWVDLRRAVRFKTWEVRRDGGEVSREVLRQVVEHHVSHRWAAA